MTSRFCRKSNLPYVQKVRRSRDCEHAHNTELKQVFLSHSDLLIVYQSTIIKLRNRAKCGEIAPFSLLPLRSFTRNCKALHLVRRASLITTTSRRIPIKHPSAGPSGTAGGGQTTNAPPGAWASSLDLVFSFSRSAAFFGENLPSGPSFIDPTKYRRPARSNDDGDSSLTGSRSGREHSEDRDEESNSIVTTSDDDDGDGEGRWSVDDEFIDGQLDSWEGDHHHHHRPPGRLKGEQLPSNAIAPLGRRTSGAGAGAGGKRRTKSTNHGSQSIEGSSPASSTDRLPYAKPSPPTMNALNRVRDRQHDERSPLISSSSSASRRDHINDTNYASNQASPLLSPSYNSNKPPKYVNGHTNTNRRLSIISSEAWSAAVEEHRGESTWGQTLFNTVNVLIGVGLLAEPLAFADAGWAIGTVLLLFCALVTNYTGKMLASIMLQDSSLLTYADVLIKAYGTRAKNIIYSLFILELGALSIALCVLFADSMESLFPTISTQVYKISFFFIILPMTFLPLRFLSLTSLIGIISSFTLLIVLVMDGALKTHQPGSLRDPMPTSVEPRWMRLPLSFGLLMSGFAGHAVIPSLYRDMKNPRQFASMIDTAYIIAFIISMLFGTLGYLMFGNEVSSEVTRDLLATKGNPAVLNKIAVWMVALNPVVKYAVANAPLVQTFEVMLGIQKPRAPPTTERPSRPRLRSPHHSSASAILEGSAIASEEDSSSFSGVLDDENPRPRQPFLLKNRAFITRPILTALIVVLAIVIPDFGRVLSFLGSASAFIICCIGPIGAYLILGSPKYRNSGNQNGLKANGNAVDHFVSSSISRSNGEEGDILVVKGFERVLCWILLIIAVLLAITGTVWSFLPVDKYA